MVGCAISMAAETGRPVVFSPAVAGGDEMVWYLADWGDGTLTPSSHGYANRSPRFSKVWNNPGDYPVSFRAITLSGRLIDQTPRMVSVTGSVTEVEEILSAQRSDDPPVERDPYIPQSITLQFETVEAIGALVLAKHPDAPFPDSFCVEVSTDGGEIWNDVPAASWTHFPDPEQKEVRIPLHGLAANAVRISSYRSPEVERRKYALRLGEIRAVGTRLLFTMDTSPVRVADWNNLWQIYGAAANEVQRHFVPYPWANDRPDEGGMLMIGSTIWAHWNAMKLAWMDNPEAKKHFETTVNLYPQDEQGLLGVAPGEFYHLGHSKHYVTPAIFISGMSHWYLMNRDEKFLNTRDQKTGIPLLEKIRKAMRYQLEDLDGKTGVLTIHDPEHDGTVNGKSGNYWDGWRFGYKSAYANQLFYQSLDWMARLETALGNPDKAAEYEALRPWVKQRFNEVFWNEKTGRFIGCIGKDGTSQDYGFTFVNLEAVACGIATTEHAERILQWLDGERIVEGDTSTGADIYCWKVAPRANTLAAEAVEPSFWDSWTMKVGPGTIGEYGGQIQNGGQIFYVSYYDLMSRLKTRGIDDAMKRMDVILDEFHKDNLRRKPSNRFGSTHVEGILREFPESGLVPLFFIAGILGLEPDAAGLRIAPALPDGWNYAEVTEFLFAGRKYRIRAERNLEQPKATGTDLVVPAQRSWILKPNGELGHAD
jgi:hypothetical protein